MAVYSHRINTGLSGYTSVLKMGDVGKLGSLHRNYPNYVCVIVERTGRADDLPPLDKVKYLVPKNFTVGQFMFMMRKRMTLPPEKALFFFVNNMLPTSSSTLAELYGVHGRDGFLKIMYTGENTFGFSVAFSVAYGHI